MPIYYSNRIGFTIAKEFCNRFAFAKVIMKHQVPAFFDSRCSLYLTRNSIYII